MLPRLRLVIGVPADAAPVPLGYLVCDTAAGELIICVVARLDAGVGGLVPPEGGATPGLGQPPVALH